MEADVSANIWEMASDLEFLGSIALLLKIE